MDTKVLHSNVNLTFWRQILNVYFKITFSKHVYSGFRLQVYSKYFVLQNKFFSYNTNFKVSPLILIFY